MKHSAVLAGEPDDGVLLDDWCSVNPEGDIMFHKPPKPPVSQWERRRRDGYDLHFREAAITTVLTDVLDSMAADAKEASRGTDWKFSASLRLEYCIVRW